MNLTVTFDPRSDPSWLAPWREKYLQGLPEPQELLLELAVPDCTAHAIVHRGEDCGYVLLTPTGVMLEFYLDRAHWVFGETVLRQALKALNISVALIKTFDALLLSSAVSLPCTLHPKGLLVRDYVPRALPELAQISYTTRQAELADLPALLAVDQDVFNRRDRLKQVVAAGYIFLFENADQLVGFGIIRPLRAGSRAVDLGIAVDAPFRNKGYAIYMMRDLVEHSIERGYRPIAGCSMENLPSRRMGERIGLVARHRLLEVTFRAEIQDRT